MIEGWEPWVEKAFKDTLPAMQASIFSKFGSDKEVTILPDFESRNSE
jgi:hypothetical protein